MSLITMFYSNPTFYANRAGFSTLITVYENGILGCLET